MAPPIGVPHPNDIFPHKGVDWVSGETVTIHNRDEAWERISNWGVPDSHKYLFAVNRLLTPQHMKDGRSCALIARYRYCSDTMVAPYPGCYDDQPPQWIHAHGIIKYNIQAAQDYLSRTREKAPN